LTLFAKLLAVVALLVFFVGLLVAKVDPPGCRLFSVDTGASVAANRKVLDEIPVYRDSTLMYEVSHGSRVANDRCLAFENSGPYDSFATFVRYRMPPGSTFDDVAAFYSKQLGMRGWRLPKAWTPLERTYVRGDARLNLQSAQGETFWELVVDHVSR
jgi:hypothetical protein